MTASALESKGNATLHNTSFAFLYPPCLYSKSNIKHNGAVNPTSPHALFHSLISPIVFYAVLVAIMLLTLILSLVLGLHLHHSQAIPVGGGGGNGQAANTVVSLPYGQYQGTALANGVTQWLGMRYAAPPTGDLRFAAPQKPATHSGLVLADQVCYGLELTSTSSCFRDLVDENMKEHPPSLRWLSTCSSRQGRLANALRDDLILFKIR